MVIIFEDDSQIKQNEQIKNIALKTTIGTSIILVVLYLVFIGLSSIQSLIIFLIFLAIMNIFPNLSVRFRAKQKKYTQHLRADETNFSIIDETNNQQVKQIAIQEVQKIILITIEKHIFMVKNSEEEKEVQETIKTIGYAGSAIGSRTEVIGANAAITTARALQELQELRNKLFGCTYVNGKKIEKFLDTLGYDKEKRRNIITYRTKDVKL